MDFVEFSGLWYYKNNNLPSDLLISSTSCCDMSYSNVNLKKNDAMSKFDSDNYLMKVMKPNTMPTPSGAPWNIQEMPWISNYPQPQVMEFNAQTDQVWGSGECLYHIPRGVSSKRKIEDDPFVARKQLITDEKMAAHFNGLHITSEIPPQNNFETNTMDAIDISMESDVESRLKAAQKIVLSDEFKLIQNDPIIPQAILNHLEKPCKAVVLYQPRQRIQIIPRQSQEDTDDEQENNNSLNVDLNMIDSNMDI